MKALKTYRCGEPKGSSKAPPPKIEALMVKHLGPHARIFAGGEYARLPEELKKALIADKALEG